MARLGSIASRLQFGVSIAALLAVQCGARSPLEDEPFSEYGTDGGTHTTTHPALPDDEADSGAPGQNNDDNNGRGGRNGGDDNGNNTDDNNGRGGRGRGNDNNGDDNGGDNGGRGGRNGGGDNG